VMPKAERAEILRCAAGVDARRGDATRDSHRGTWCERQRRRSAPAPE
jgi:hypothetical protein